MSHFPSKNSLFSRNEPDTIGRHGRLDNLGKLHTMLASFEPLGGVDRRVLHDSRIGYLHHDRFRSVGHGFRCGAIATSAGDGLVQCRSPQEAFRAPDCLSSGAGRLRRTSFVRHTN
jgi:hypothetical protein